MATIVQPYNPWRENLAVTVLGNVLGDLWKQHKQNEQNKKANAFRGQLMQDIQSLTGAQAPVSLTQQNLPEGYNSDGWASSFHDSYTPLTAFDLGTAGAAGTARLPTADEVQRLGTNLASTKRFSMLNPDTIQGFISQITKQNEEQRLKDIQNNYANMFSNAKTLDEQLKALTLANFYGLGEKAVTPFGNWAIHRTPNQTFHEINAGNNIYASSFDPATGEINPSVVFPVGITPYQQASIEAQRYATDQNNATHIYGYNVNSDTQRYVADQNSATHRYGYDVNAAVNREKNAQSYEGGKDSNNVKSVVALIKSLDNEEKSLTKKLEVAHQAHSWAVTKEEHDATQAEIDRIKGELQSVRERREELMQHISPQRNQSSQPQNVAPTVLGENEPSQPQIQTQTTEQPAASLPIVLGTVGQDIRPVIPTQNATVPTDLSGNISDDVHVARSNTTSADIKPQATSQSQKTFIRGNDLPTEMQYNPERDKDIPSENILTRKQLGAIIAQIMANRPQETAHMTPLLLAYQLFKYKGIRIKDLKD